MNEPGPATVGCDGAGALYCLARTIYIYIHTALHATRYGLRTQFDAEKAAVPSGVPRPVGPS